MEKNIYIGINGSMLDERPTGVGVFSYNLVNQISALFESPASISVFTPTKKFLNTGIHIIKLSDLLQSSKYGKLAAFSRFLWNTFLYPIQSRKFHLLLSLTTHGSLFSKNQIITIHDLLSLRYKNISAHQRLYFKYMLPLMIARSKLIITVSESTKKDILKFFGCPAEKVKVVYNGYDPKVFHFSGIKTKKIESVYNVNNYLLAVGPTYPHKNFEFLIRAYHKLSVVEKEKHPLVIIGGRRQYLTTIQKLVTDLGMDTHIKFWGYVPSALMGDLYREAFALIFPSIHEGFGFPLLEAMASGCPVLVSDTSSMPEVCGDAALYFDPYNAKSLSIAIEKIITDRELYHELREKGLARANNFSWEKAAGDIMDIIKNQCVKI